MVEYGNPNELRGVTKYSLMRVKTLSCVIASSKKDEREKYMPPRIFRHPVMTWVPPYSTEVTLSRLNESFGIMGMKDGLTHLGLQFWCPTIVGKLQLVTNYQPIGETTINSFRDWGHANGVRVLLCVYNGVERWDWSLAQAGFANHRQAFIEALIRETERLQLDGVDIDLEGFADFEQDKAAFVGFTRELSQGLHDQGRHLTVDSLSYKWNAPNWNWWPELLPLVDGLTTMSYEEIGARALDWGSYAAQKAKAGAEAAKLLLGMRSDLERWQDNSVLEQLQWVADDDGVGLSIWDARLQSPAWTTEAVWKKIQNIRDGRRSN
jgi:hypothetical protein